MAFDTAKKFGYFGSQLENSAPSAFCNSHLINQFGSITYYVPGTILIIVATTIRRCSCLMEEANIYTTKCITVC